MSDDAYTQVREIIAEALDLADPETAAEQVIYTPAATGAEPRTIAAIVARNAAAEYGNVRTAAITLTVLNDAAAGIAAATMDAGKDTVTVAERPGGTPAPRHLGRILEMNHAFITMEVR